MKKCFKCNENKDLSDFYKHTQMHDGHLNKCKKCTKSDVKNNGADYDSTEKGVIRVLYKTQKRNNKIRGFGSLTYSKDEFRDWLYDNNFKTLYDLWVKLGKPKNRKPSPDRLDDLKGYSFDNMLLTTWGENHKKAFSDRARGIGSQGSVCKPVEKIDEDGNVVAAYVSYWEAVRCTGYSIEYQLKKGVQCRSGFYWNYIK